MKVAVVILNWNGREMLERYLPQVMQYSSSDAEVFVADNASTDDSVEFVSQHFPTCKLIQLDKNYGFAGGYNKALEQIKSDYYVLLNSDVEVTHEWLVPLIEFMDSHQHVAACQPKLLSVVDKDSFEYAGACGGFIDKYGYPFCRGRIFDTIEQDLGQYNNVMPIFWATGACLMVRSECYWAVGGLDESFFAHNEEIDFCWQLHLLGYDIYCIPDSVVYHLGGGTLPKSNPRKTYLNFRNNLAMLYKNLSEDELKPIMRTRFVFDYIAAFKLLLSDGGWQEFKAVVKARKDFKQMIPQLTAKRKHIQANVVQKTIKERISFFLLWQYYAKKRKLFSQLEPMED